MVNFDIVNGKVVVDASTLTVSAFNDIWEYDTGKGSNKPKASNMLTYVFHMRDPREKNPFRDVPEHEKELVCKRNAFGNANHKFKEEEEALIKKAMAWYEYLNTNSIQRLSLSLDRKLDQMAAYLDDPINDIITPDQLDSQVDMIAKLDKIIISKQKADAFVKEEMNKTKVKGNVQRSALESGALD